MLQMMIAVILVCASFVCVNYVLMYFIFSSVLAGRQLSMFEDWLSLACQPKLDNYNISKMLRIKNIGGISSVFAF
jgi:hypothetical protein